ncbi:MULTISPECIES: universal stress protein [Niastella]|uniref:Universal stress protein n=1 Tax=Niastella soli TaxID=2821487 RepID=A0ABS3Z2A6_9BACT|nr:universal stress protein [Niastella soli]MBO9204302.1 universal stress protein [Niastella soli]
MKKILIATDYSAEAENAAAYAAAVASEQGHELILFNYSEISIHLLNARVSGNDIDEMLELFQKNLNKAAEALSKKFNVQVTPYLASGNFYESLVACINQFKPVVVVMGMANRSVEQDLLGNTTTSTIHKLEFPLLAIPVSAQYHPIRNILFACDMEKGVEEKVLKNVHEIAAAFGATVEVFYVTDTIEALQEADEADHASIDKNLAGISYYYKNVQSLRIINAIQEEIKDTHADLLIMSPYKYGFWDSMVHRSKTRMMASGNNIPLLSLPS